MVSQLDSVEAVDGFKVKDETLFVAYLGDADGPEAKAFADVAERYREEFSFGLVSDPAVAESQKATVPSVVCYRTADGDTVTFSAFDQEQPSKLEDWVKEASRSVVGELTVQNRQRLLEVSVLPQLFSL